MLISWKNYVGLDATRYAHDFKTSRIDLDTLARGIQKCCWSAMVFRNKHRAEANFIQSDLCVLDFDDGETTLSDAVENFFPDMQHIIATTKSHQLPKGDKPACDRFRVIIPWETTITDLTLLRHNLILLVN